VQSPYCAVSNERVDQEEKGGHRVQLRGGDKHFRNRTAGGQKTRLPEAGHI